MIHLPLICWLEFWETLFGMKSSAKIFTLPHKKSVFPHGENVRGQL